MLYHGRGVIFHEYFNGQAFDVGLQCIGVAASAGVVDRMKAESVVAAVDVVVVLVRSPGGAPYIVVIHLRHPKPSEKYVKGEHFLIG